MIALLSGPYSILARIGATIAVVAAIFGYGYLKGLQHDEAAHEKATASFIKQSIPVLEKWHERTVTVHDRAPNVQPNLERLCTDWVVRRAGGPAPSGPSEADNGKDVAGLATDINACLLDSADLDALYAVLKPQVKR